MNSQNLVPALALGCLGIMLVVSTPLDAGEGHERGNGHAGSENAHKKVGSESAHVRSAEPSAPSKKALELPGKSYGHGVTIAHTTTIEDLFADPDKYVGKRVRIEGKITEVCPMAGCWINVKSDSGDKQVTFKVKDGVIVFPTDDAGKHAVAEGVVSKNELNLKRTRAYLGHFAEETGKPFDPASVTEPMTLIRVMGTGAVVQ